MAAPGVYHNAATATADFESTKEAFAYEQGHDADIPINQESSQKDTEEDLEKLHAQSAEKTVEVDPNDVWWDGDDDPHNPMNWPARKKWFNIAILSYCTLITPLASSMFAPGVPEVMRDFREESKTLATFVVSIYLIGFSFGPLLIAPMSELYGRYWIYIVCNIGFIIFAVACGLAKNMGQLIAFRFIHGIFGVGPLTIGGGTISDVMPVERRGSAMAIFSMGPLLGPVIGPIGGGFLIAAKSWRWVFWLLAILGGAALILCVVFLRESYAPTLLEHKAKKLRKETGNQQLRSRLAIALPASTIFAMAVVRPTKMLLLSPIVAAVAWYVAIAYGILYLLFTTFTFVFQEQYHFSTRLVGLAFIPLGIGMILALFVVGGMTDRIIKGKQARGEAVKPEDRMPLGMILIAALCLPVGLFTYGWTAQYEVHWIVPMIGNAICGFGLLVIFMALQTYLIDAFIRYAASVIAAITVLRSLLGGLLPLCGLQMYQDLGLGWGNSLLGFLSLALVPVPIIFIIYGERIRSRFQIKI